MNIALILSGGSGVRTGQNVPKQYLTVFDTPLIVYTMLNIQETELFDELYVVCSNGWSDFISSYAKQYNIGIFKDTIAAGNTRFESISNGFNALYSTHKSDDVVALFDANRPAIPHNVISESLLKLEPSSCVVALEPCYDSMFYAEKTNNFVTGFADRSALFMGQNPETIYLNDAYEAAKFNSKSGKDYPVAAIMLQMNKKVVFVEGSSKSMKITTADDFAILKAIIGDKKINPIKKERNV